MTSQERINRMHEWATDCQRKGNQMAADLVKIIKEKKGIIVNATKIKMAIDNSIPLFEMVDITIKGGKRAFQNFIWPPSYYMTDREKDSFGHVIEL